MEKIKSKDIILADTREYVQDIYAKRLIEEGFTSFDDNYFRWYRVVNGEIFNSVCFFTTFRFLPTMLQIAYATHPFFDEPYIPKHPLVSNLWEHNEKFSQQFLFDMGTNAYSVSPHTPESSVVCINAESRETYTFDRIILPNLERGKTIEDCYAIHKQYYMNLTDYPVEQRFGYRSELFVDEAIYVDDREICQYLRPTVEDYLDLYTSHLRRKPNNKEYLRTYAVIKRQKEVLEHGLREEYLDELNARTDANKEKFKKKWKVSF